MSLAGQVQELLAPGGPIAARWRRYEERPSQRELAGEIAEVLEHGGVLLAEAATGLGKSLAYLLPSVLLAAREDRRVVVATCTRSLQDQLFERDLPALLGVLGLELRCARLKRVVGDAIWACKHNHTVVGKWFFQTIRMIAEKSSAPLPAASVVIRWT